MSWQATEEQETSARLYAKRDIMELGQRYVDHVMAMTAEGLHDKSEIAAELAQRDMAIESLTKRCLMMELVAQENRLLLSRARTYLVIFQVSLIKGEFQDRVCNLLADIDKSERVDNPWLSKGEENG